MCYVLKMDVTEGELADVTNHPRKRAINKSDWSKSKEKQRRNSGESKF